MTDYAPPAPNPWLAHRMSLKKHLREDNLDNFMQWSTVQATMYVGYSPRYLQHEIDYLQARPDWIRWQSACKRTGEFGDELIDGMGCNALHQAFHLCQWETATNNKIEYLVKIIEFGGGYGEMAHVCHRLGFRGKYMIYDFEEVRHLQEYYLRRVTPFMDYHIKDPRKIAPMEADLLIGIASLSETPPKERQAFLDPLKIHGALFLYQQTFENYDNVALFKSITERWPLKWQGWPVEHYKSHHYLVG
jgi:hypothetical protein